MNAMQCQLRQEIHVTARSRGFHFDSVKVASVGDFLSVQAWCGHQAVTKTISFRELVNAKRSSFHRQKFVNRICDAMLSQDEVMSKRDTIVRRREAWVMHRIYRDEDLALVLLREQAA